MGAAVSWCGGGLSRGFSTLSEHGGVDQALVLRVMRAPIEESLGARLSSYVVDDELEITRLETVAGLEVLGLRHNDQVRSRWPTTYRFQAPRRSWHATVNSGSRLGRRPEACLLQLALHPEDRTLEHVELDLQDAKDAASYAHRFSQYQRQRAAEGDMLDAESLPAIKVAAPVACQVISSCYPAMIPVGAACTLTPYPWLEVTKLVFSGSEEFMELPQAFFHYAAFASNGKQLVCDIQGVEDDNGNFVIVDPCVLRAELPQVADLVGGALPGLSALAKGAIDNGPSLERFDALHPRCAQLCKAFDPQRGSVKRNVGVCGIGGTCGLGRQN